MTHIQRENQAVLHHAWRCWSIGLLTNMSVDGATRLCSHEALVGGLFDFVTDGGPGCEPFETRGLHWAIGALFFYYLHSHFPQTETGAWISSAHMCVIWKCRFLSFPHHIKMWTHTKATIHYVQLYWKLSIISAHLLAHMPARIVWASNWAPEGIQAGDTESGSLFYDAHMWSGANLVIMRLDGKHAVIY